MRVWVEVVERNALKPIGFPHNAEPFPDDEQGDEMVISFTPEEWRDWQQVNHRWELWQDIIEGRLEHLETKIVLLEQHALHTGYFDSAYTLEAARRRYLKTIELETAAVDDLRTYHAVLEREARDNRYWPEDYDETD